jgi:hypothetical protein
MQHGLQMVLVWSDQSTSSAHQRIYVLLSYAPVNSIVVCYSDPDLTHLYFCWKRLCSHVLSHTYIFWICKFAFYVFPTSCRKDQLGSLNSSLSLCFANESRGPILFWLVPADVHGEKDLRCSFRVRENKRMNCLFIVLEKRYCARFLCGIWMERWLIF